MTDEAEAVEVTALNQSDLDYLDDLLSELPDSEVHQRLRSMLESGSIGQLTYSKKQDLTAFNAVMVVINRWRPAVDEDGYITSTPTGDYDNIDQLDRDALYLATLNVELGMLMGKLSAQAEAAKMDIDFTKSQLRNEMRKRKKTDARFRKLTDKQVDEISRCHKRFVDSVELWIATNELAKMFSSAYFSAQRVEDKLTGRIKTLLSEWGKSNCHGTRN
jgi:hypothetical protein